MTGVSQTRVFRTAALIALAAASTLTLAACNGKVRPTGVLPREYVPPPPSERNAGITPKQGELTAPPVQEQAPPLKHGLSVPSR
ncbi:hypothetical protein [Camelimonas lactis]|uniref:Lipoprotein n=1 Tax=Camelimonas lactis TaxID=659006 RepID=A0A4R2GT87_9HYPH|nr:hypothetical protein [Camelimonas lactis]TCO13429.1 hypothetical protein EV666_106141 [Camelimonas lactis]